MGTQTTRAVSNKDADAVAAAELANFFEAKVSQIRFGLDTTADDVGLSPIHSHIPSPVADPSTRLADFRQLTTDDVRELISSSPNKSCCLDAIPTVLLKRFIDFLVSPITAILNLSLSSGTFPSALKHASISPLLKKPNLDPDDPNSYRPVSNLPFLSKIIERAIFIQLSGHLARHDLLPDRQSAYRQNYSTETALLSLRDDLLRATDDGIGTAIVLLDLSAAFDTIDHDVLLDLLNRHCGLTGPALSWFTNSSCQDRQRLVTDDQQSFQSSPRLSSGRDSVHHLYLPASFIDSYRRRHHRRFF
jgi:hypothetical protein